MSESSFSAPTVPGPLAAWLGEARAVLEGEILPRYLQRCRWFGGKARSPRRCSVLAGPQVGRTNWAFVRAEFSDGGPEVYFMPLAAAEGSAAAEIAASLPEAVIGRTAAGAILFDGIHDAEFRTTLHGLMAGRGVLHGPGGDFRGIGSPLLDAAAAPPESRVFSAEQSNSSLVFGGKIFVKIYRKVETGVNPDAEVTRFLSERQHFAHTAKFAGELEYRRAGMEPSVLAMATELVPNRGDAWKWALAVVREFLGRVDGRQAPSGRPPGFLECAAFPAELNGAIGEDVLARVRLLGERTAGMHRALAAEAGDPAFAPEEFGGADVRALSVAVARSVERLLEMTQSRAGEAVIAELLAQGRELRGIPRQIESGVTAAAKTRTHGDYHLGQVLDTGDDFLIIDFEGEPARPLSERKEKRSPLRDVAGMLRSFHYAAHVALKESPGGGHAADWAEWWAAATGNAFATEWLAASRGAPFLPKRDEDAARLLHAFLLEKAIYEVDYELNNRPDWVAIPVRGILRLLSS